MTRTSDHSIPLSGHGVTFVKLANLPAAYGWSGVGVYRSSRAYNAVHIETDAVPYGGSSTTLCGRDLRVGRYIFVCEWHEELGYHTCQQCWSIYRRVHPDVSS